MSWLFYNNANISYVCISICNNVNQSGKSKCNKLNYFSRTFYINTTDRLLCHTMVLNFYARRKKQKQPMYMGNAAKKLLPEELLLSLSDSRHLCLYLVTHRTLGGSELGGAAEPLPR